MIDHSIPCVAAYAVPYPDDLCGAVRLGRLSTGLQQGGWSWTIDQGALLNASVQFIWRRAGVLLGQTTVTTTASHPTADFGSPPHYSARECQLP